MTFPTEAEAQAFLRRIGAPLATGHPTNTAVVIPATHGYWVITDPKESEQPAKICCICGEAFHEFPCNALPVAEGGCCAYCDDHVVTPARIRLVRQRGAS